MFGSNLVLPRGGILSYEQALTRHDSIVPIRGRSVDTRPLGNRGNDNMTIRQDADGSIAIRLYSTDIIVYRTDGTIELEPYTSVLTNDIVHQVLRGAVRPEYGSVAGPVLWVKDKGYRIPDFAVLDKDHNLIAGSEPFTHYQIDRKKSKAAATDSGYSQFALWLKTQLRLGIDPRQGNRWDGISTSNGTLSSLDEPDRYGDIARGWSAYHAVDIQLGLLRQAVLREYDAITEKSVPYVNDRRELRSIVSAKRRLG